MTPLATTLGFGDFAIIAWLVVVFAGCAIYHQRPSPNQRRIERKLDALLKFHNISMPLEATLSDEVQTLARSGHKPEAIMMHREQTGLGLAAAKADIEDFLKSGPK
jgi:hypothetical protein